MIIQYYKAKVKLKFYFGVYWRSIMVLTWKYVIKIKDENVFADFEKEYDVVIPV